MIRANAAAPLLLALLLVGGAVPSKAGGSPAASDRQSPQVPQVPGRGGRGAGRVYKAQITPHWFDNGARFWYRNDLKGEARQFVLVDAEAGTRRPAFDHDRLAAALSKAAGTDVRSDRLPFDEITFVDGTKAVRFKTAKGAWKCDLTSYDCTPMETAEPGGTTPAAAGASVGATPASPEIADADEPTPARRPAGRGERSARSPDGKWTAVVKDYNLYLRPRDGGADAKDIQLTSDGKEGLAYGMPQWSRDSKALVAFRIEPGDRKEVYLVESSPRGGGRAVLHSRPYDLPGDKFTAYELNLFDVESHKQTKPEVERIDFGTPRLRWRPDGRHFTYEKVDRGHQRFRVIEVDSHTGESRNLIDEQSKTFIWTAHRDGMNFDLVSWLDKSDEILYVSEQEGWRHLYLYDANSGRLKNQITKGEWVVRGIDKIDEENRQVWFRASGIRPDQDPYLIHYCRINFDGTGLVILTEGNGNHTATFSPDRKYLIDTYSRVDMAPVHELRRVSDGSLVCELERADISDLKASGWEAPKVFVAKGRDGKTDIWGIIVRPKDFDPEKKYPVVESIYAGPQGSFVPKTFSPVNRYAAMANLGFIVVQIDGMGTANRSKAFHDVCWHNLKDAGFEDRILWHKAAAVKYSYYDITRVGIYGGSAGGQNAAGGVLCHPEFYQVAVANCGCHDNRMDKASWNEQWMGYPVGPQYAESSNIEHAANLKGHLLLIVGEMDTNVPPESTYRFVDALTRAGKDFDFVLVPGANHGAPSPITQRRQSDFFVRHLLGKEPPNRNAAGRGD